LSFLFTWEIRAWHYLDNSIILQLPIICKWMEIVVFLLSLHSYKAEQWTGALYLHTHNTEQAS
jgi:hypothetical protein